MTSVIVPSVDLAPSLPSRVVTVELIDVTEGQAVAGAEIDFFLPGDLHVPADDVIVQAGKVTLTLDNQGKGRVRLPAYTDAITPSDWVIGVKKRWAPHPYFIRVPAGSTAISLADIPAVQTLPQGVVDWMITGAAVTVTEGNQWAASLNLVAGILNLDLTVPPGAEPYWRGQTGLTSSDNLDSLAPGVYSVRSYQIGLDLGLPRGAQGTLEVQAYSALGQIQVWRPRFTGSSLQHARGVEMWQRNKTTEGWTDWYAYTQQSDFRLPQSGGQSGGGEALLHSFPDANHRETWLGARASDGGPTEYGEYHLRHRLGITQTSGPYQGFGDAAGVYTELRVNSDTGRVPADVLQSWGARAGWGKGSGLAPGDRYINGNGDLVPVFPITDHIIGWGSSSMQLGAADLASQFPETTFINEGKSGEWSNHIAARMGAIPALLTVTGGEIPASGQVEVSASNMPTSTYLKPFVGTLAGVRGTLSSTASALTFTRQSAGEVTPVDVDTPFIPEMPTVYRQYVGMVWAGKNNLWVSGQVPKVLADTRAMFEHFTPLVKRVLVLNHFVHTSQGPGTILHQQVHEANDSLADEFGGLCVDINAYLLSSQVWADTGITPTSEDLQQQADGVKPEGLSSDDGHLNQAAESAVARLVRSHAEHLGWY